MRAHITHYVNTLHAKRYLDLAEQSVTPAFVRLLATVPRLIAAIVASWIDVTPPPCTSLYSTTHMQQSMRCLCVHAYTTRHTERPKFKFSHHLVLTTHNSRSVMFDDTALYHSMSHDVVSSLYSRTVISTSRRRTTIETPLKTHCTSCCRQLYHDVVLFLDSNHKCIHMSLW